MTDIMLSVIQDVLAQQELDVSNLEFEVEEINEDEIPIANLKVVDEDDIPISKLKVEKPKKVKVVKPKKVKKESTEKKMTPAQIKKETDEIILDINERYYKYFNVPVSIMGVFCKSSVGVRRMKHKISKVKNSDGWSQVKFILSSDVDEDGVEPICNEEISKKIHEEFRKNNIYLFTDKKKDRTVAHDKKNHWGSLDREFMSKRYPNMKQYEWSKCLDFKKKVETLIGMKFVNFNHYHEAMEHMAHIKNIVYWNFPETVLLDFIKTVLKQNKEEVDWIFRGDNINDYTNVKWEVEQVGKEIERKITETEYNEVRNYLWKQEPCREIYTQPIVQELNMNKRMWSLKFGWKGFYD